MAALVNISSKKTSKVSATDLTSDSFTIGGSNRAMVVLVYSGEAPPVVCTGVKWGGSGGVAMTKIADSGAFATYGWATLWLLKNPTAGSGTVYATWGSAQSERMMICLALEDADQTTPNGTVAVGANSTLVPSQNATAVVGDLVLNFLALMDSRPDVKSLTAGATSDQEIEGLEGGNLDGYEMAGAQHTTAASTSQAMAWVVAGVGTAEANWIYMFSMAINGATGGGSQGLGGAHILNRSTVNPGTMAAVRALAGSHSLNNAKAHPGTLSMVRALAGSNIPSGEAFCSCAVVVNAVTLAGSFSPSSNVFRTASVTVGPVSLAGSFSPAGNAFYTAALAMRAYLAGAFAPAGDRTSPGSLTVGAAGLAGVSIPAAAVVNPGVASPGAVPLAGSNIPASSASNAGTVAAGGTVLAGGNIPAAAVANPGSTAVGSVPLAGANIPAGSVANPGTVAAASGAANLGGSSIPAADILRQAVITVGGVALAGDTIRSMDRVLAGLVAVGGKVLAGANIPAADLARDGTFTFGAVVLGGAFLSSAEVIQVANVVPGAKALAGLHIPSMGGANPGTVDTAARLLGVLIREAGVALPGSIGTGAVGLLGSFSPSTNTFRLAVLGGDGVTVVVFKVKGESRMWRRPRGNSPMNRADVQ